MQMVVEQSCGWALCMEHRDKDFASAVALSVKAGYFISSMQRI